MFLHFDENEIFEGLYLLYEIIGSIDEVCRSCVYSFEDVVYKYGTWVNMQFSVVNTLINLLLASGDIAQNVLYLYFYFEDLPYHCPRTPRELGHVFGDFVALIFNNPKFKDGVIYYNSSDIDKDKFN